MTHSHLCEFEISFFYYHQGSVVLVIDLHRNRQVQRILESIDINPKGLHWLIIKDEINNIKHSPSKR
jgi:hypothetical protein